MCTKAWLLCSVGFLGVRFLRWGCVGAEWDWVTEDSESSRPVWSVPSPSGCLGLKAGKSHSWSSCCCGGVSAQGPVSLSFLNKLSTPSMLVDEELLLLGDANHFFCWKLGAQVARTVMNGPLKEWVLRIAGAGWGEPWQWINPFLSFFSPRSEGFYFVLYSVTTDW